MLQTQAGISVFYFDTFRDAIFSIFPSFFCTPPALRMDSYFFGVGLPLTQMKIPFEIVAQRDNMEESEDMTVSVRGSKRIQEVFLYMIHNNGTMK